MKMFEKALFVLSIITLLFFLFLILTAPKELVGEEVKNKDFIKGMICYMTFVNLILVLGLYRIIFEMTSPQKWSAVVVILIILSVIMNFFSYNTLGVIFAMIFVITGPLAIWKYATTAPSDAPAD